MTEPLELRAPAKLNLTLEILGRRTDGYHDLASVMQTISLYDTLTFAPRPGGEIILECDEPSLAANPQANLVWRAARLLQQVRGVGAGAAITLAKGIPTAAGLGGGSSDAAAALLGLNRLWELGLQRGELLNVAGLLGSDVPFLLEGGTARVSGRGDEVVPLRPLLGGWFVLITPGLPLANKTVAVYGLLRSFEYTNGLITQRLAETLATGGLPDATLLYNGMEDAVFRAFEPLDAIRQQVVAAGGDGVRVAGAGPSLFIYFPDEAAARALADALAGAGLPVHVVEPVPGRMGL